MPLSVENTARLQAFQAKSLQGTLTIDEQREAIAIIRQDRMAAQTSSTTSRTAKAEAAKPIDAGALLSKLKLLGAKLATGPVEGS
jgi:hypothetical protein